MRTSPHMNNWLDVDVCTHRHRNNYMLLPTNMDSTCMNYRMVYTPSNLPSSMNSTSSYMMSSTSSMKSSSSVMHFA